jgi:archaellum component FlaG (FlaF/FlaG flagellin family)
MANEINIGVQIKSHGPWPTIEKMYCGFAFSDYVTKEAIPEDLRFRDMVVFENTIDGVKEYILDQGVKDADYVEKTKIDETTRAAKAAEGIAMGSFYAYDQGLAFGITKTDTLHPVLDDSEVALVDGYAEKISFIPGNVTDSNITAEANPSAAVLEIECSKGHQLSNGDLVVLVNMNNAGHDGVTRVTVVDTTKFTCDDIEYVAGAGASAGSVLLPAFLRIPVSGSDGAYHITLSITGTPGAAAKNWQFAVMVERSVQEPLVTEITTVATPMNISLNGICQLSANQRVWVSAKNLTDTSDFTISYMNLSIHKIN